MACFSSLVRFGQAPLLTALPAIVLDLFIDPVAVVAGYWVWFVRGTVYFDIPLLNYVGWFVLMVLAPLAWILIGRQRNWGYLRKGGVAVVALLPMIVAAVLGMLAGGSRSCCCAYTAIRSGCRSAIIGPGMCFKPRSLARQARTLDSVAPGAGS